MDNCPKCKSSWIGGEIPESIRRHYSPPYVWKREIGIDGGYIGVYDGVVAYRCPDCDEEFPVSDSVWAMEMFNKYKEKVREA